MHNPSIDGLVGITGDQQLVVGQLGEATITLTDSAPANSGSLTLDAISGADEVKIYLPDCTEATLPHTWTLPLESGLTFPFNIKILALARASDVELQLTYTGTSNESQSDSFTFDIVEASYPTSVLLPGPQELAGSKYRKIALNGAALPDEKPQAKEETDNPSEETYVDALTLQLTHQTTDIYLSVPASDLALSVRRDLAGEVVSERDLYKGGSRPDRPFGAGWTSNITPHLRIESTLTIGRGDTKDFYYDRYVYAVDHNGSEHRFVAKTNKIPQPSADPSTPLAVTWNEEIASGDQAAFDALPSSLLESDAGQNTLTLVGGVYELRLKNGTRIRYEGTPLSYDRSINSYIEDSEGGNPCEGIEPVVFTVVGAVTRQTARFIRAVQVTDPKGATLDYIPGTGLIPSEIRANNSLTNRIVISTASGVVSKITDPRGNEYDYQYNSLSSPSSDFSPAVTLERVLRPAVTQSGVSVRPLTCYTYSVSVAGDPTPGKLQAFDKDGNQDPVSTLHINLLTLTDARDATYGFSYIPDLSVKAHAETPDFTGDYPVNSKPFLLSRVTLPDGGHSDFSRTGILACSYGFEKDSSGERGKPYAILTSTESRVTTVTAADGSSRTYSFEGPSLLPVLEENINTSTDPQYPPVFIAHEKMVITHGVFDGALLKESVSYDFQASPGPVEVVDVSGGKTEFAYNATLPARTTFKAVYTANPEPTSQTNALGQTKHFTYDPEWWAMRTIIDEAGVKTEYVFDKDVSGMTNLGRRVAEIISAPAVGSTPGAVVQRTDFAYTSSSFHGFMTRRTVRALSGAGDPSWVTDLSTLYVPDANGRVAQEVVDLNANGVVDSGTDLITAYTYDANGNKLTVTDPRGNVTTFVYDALNRLTETISPDATPGTLADNPRKTLAYDLNGNRVRTTDENGVVTFTTYDVLNRVQTQVLDLNANGVADARPADAVTDYTYTPLNARELVTDPRGTATKFEYDALQRLRKKTDDLGTGRLNYETTYAYELAKNPGASVFDSTGWKPTLVTDPRGYRTRVTYDKLFRPVIEEAEYATNVFATTNKSYDAVGNLLTVTDPLGTVTKTTYDDLKRPLTVTEAFGTTLAVTSAKAYTSTGFAWKVTDALARETTTEYDAAGRPIKVFTPAVDDALTLATTLVSPVTETLYDAAGNVSAVINPLGARTDYTYDVRNRRLTEQQPSVTDATTTTASRPTRTTTYDDAGNVLTTEDARGFVTTTTYDPARRPLTVTSPLVTKPDGTTAHPVTAMTYDPAGNVLTLTDANGHVTTNVYDRLNRLATTTQSPTASSTDDIVVTNEYDPAGNRTAVIDGKSQRTEFTYDGLNRNLTIKDPANQLVTFTYDALNKTSRVDSIGQTTSYAYDVRHRLTGVSYVGRTVDNRTYAYDAVGQLLSVTEPNKTGNVADVAYTYDALGRQLTETSGGKQHVYAYDLANNRITVTYGGTGTVLTSTYDVLNRLATLTEVTRVTTYGYNLNGNRVFQSLPNGEETDTTFDALNRQTGIITTKSGGGSLLELAQAYDLVGNVARLTESYPGSTLSGRTVTNTYDRVNRLTDEVTVESVKTVATTYTFDKANNRTAKAVATTTGSGTTVVDTAYVYSNLNQLQTATEGTAVTTFTYDLNGNRASRTKGGRTETYAYDYENRLLSLTDALSSGPSALDYSYTYDYRTRRVERTEAGTTTKLVFSGGVSVSEYPGGTPSVASAEYIRGSDWGGGVGGLLYSVRSGVPSFKHYNSRGDVISETNAAGSSTWEGTYEAYGTRTQEVGSTQDRQKANTKEEDPTGLLNEGFRYRDLETGVFITRDPLGFVDGPNMYAYVIQNPWSKFDPQGLMSWGDAWDYTKAAASGAGEGLYGVTVGAVVDSYKSGVDHMAGAMQEAGEGNVGMAALHGLAAAGEVANLALTAVGAGEAVVAGKNLLVGAVKNEAKALASNTLKTEVSEAATAVTKKVDQAVEEVKDLNDAATQFGCFLAGTLITTADGYASIESITVGQRVLTPNAAGAADTDLDGQSLRLVSLETRDEASGTVLFAVKALEPIDRLERDHVSTGSRVWYEVPEIGFANTMTVVAISPCPVLEKGEGRLVTTTYVGNSSDVWTVWTQNAGVPVNATGGHPIYSETHGDWVPASALRQDDVIRTADGIATVTQVERLLGNHRVYNFTVDVEHCYYVGPESILAHNAGNPCATGAETAKGTAQTANTTGEVVHPNRPSNTADTRPWVEADPKTLKIKTADSQIPGSLKKSDSYHSEFGGHTRDELQSLKDGGGDQAKQAGQMLKLIKETERLSQKH